MNEFNSQLTKLIKREPNTADQKPPTTKPDITPDTIMRRKAFITKVNRPNVRMFRGNVNMISIGLKKALRIPSMAAAKKAEGKPLTCIPPIR